MVLQVDEAQVKLISDYLEIVLILMHCAEHTIGSKIMLDVPNGTPWWRGSCHILFRSV
jgi:hypothetical protein